MAAQKEGERIRNIENKLSNSVYDKLSNDSLQL